MMLKKRNSLRIIKSAKKNAESFLLNQKIKKTKYIFCTDDGRFTRWAFIVN